MVIIERSNFPFFVPKHKKDLAMFRHCCDGYISVRDIEEYTNVFEAHGIKLEFEKGATK